MKRPSIADLAHRAGVSKTTVSHAFSGRRHVDPDTRQRIERIAGEIGYRPNRAAQQLRTGRTGVIALASSMPFTVAAGPSRLGFLMEIAASAAMAALTRGLALCLIPPVHSVERLEAVAADGAILLEPLADDPFVAHFLDTGASVVSIGRIPGRPDIPHVDLRSGETAGMVLSHLRGCGAARIGLVTGLQRRNSHIETEAAYLADCAMAGAAPVLVRVDEAGGEAEAEHRVAALLEAHPDIDGLFVPVDAFATGAVRAAARLDRHIPDRLKIATRYDGLRARLSDPALTAVNLHLDRIADLAVGLLVDAIEGRPRACETAPPPELVVRASTRMQANPLLQ